MNPFDVLGVPESAAVDPAVLKDKYHQLSREHHPDVTAKGQDDAGNRFATINRAYQMLQSPATRLRELLRLRGKADLAAKGAIPPALLELFMGIGPVFQEADAVIEEKQRAASALAQALLAPKVMSVQDRLSEVMERLGKAMEEALADLPEADALLANRMPDEQALDAAGALCRRLLYLEKWQGQGRTRWNHLAA